MVALTEDVMAVAETLLMIRFRPSHRHLGGGAVYLCLHSWKIALGMSAFIFYWCYQLSAPHRKWFHPPAPCTRGGGQAVCPLPRLTEGVNRNSIAPQPPGQVSFRLTPDHDGNFSRHNVAAENPFHPGAS